MIFYNKDNFVYPICFLLLALVHVSSALLDGIYCGQRNCYDVLEVQRDAERSEIVKAYRLLAKKFHPDMHRLKKDKEESEEKFRDVATAYEILRDEESRKEYDYMLDHPDEYYRNYYHYYRRRYTPKVDVRIVVVVAVTLISAFQYYGAQQRYSSAIDYFAMTEKYRHQALQIAEKEKLLPEAGKGRNKKSKEELKKEKEAVIRNVIEEKMDIKGGFAKPTIRDILWVQLVFLPMTASKYLIWYFKWIWKFNIKKEEYGIEEKLHLIRKFLKQSEGEFSNLDDHLREEYLNEELWKKEIFVEWKKLQEEEQRLKQAEDPRFKRYRRFMKTRGPGQITFDE